MTTDSPHVPTLDIPDRCGNAPRKAVIRDFLVAVYSGQAETVLDYLREDIQWELIGDKVLTGYDDIWEWIQDRPKVAQVTLKSVITHGTECAADGLITDIAGTKVAFNHVMIFAGHAKTAKIKSIRSYLIAEVTH